MKRFGNANTIAEIEFVIDAPKFGEVRHSWGAHGVTCTRERHRFSGRTYSFTIEVLDLQLIAGGRPLWHAIIVSERWHAGDADGVIRTAKWLKVLNGKTSDVAAWVRRTRAAAEGKPAEER